MFYGVIHRKLWIIHGSWCNLHTNLEKKVDLSTPVTSLLRYLSNLFDEDTSQ